MEIAITPKLTIKVEQNIRYRQLVALQARAKGDSAMLREMILAFVRFKRHGSYGQLTREQYEQMPAWMSAKINTALSEEFLQEGKPDPADKHIVTLPSGQVVRYRTALTKDRITAEQFSEKTPEMLTSYMIAATMEFQNEQGEFETRMVEDIVEMSLQDGYAMSQILNNQEDADLFFQLLEGGESENTASDSSITDSRTAKSKK